MKVRIFVEGKDKTSRPLQSLRLGFQAFFRNGLPEQEQPSIEMCGPRGTAHRDFCDATKKKTSTFNILLVDSEVPVSPGNTTWQHLESSDNWDNCGTSDDHCHLMVQTMEAWIIADVKALKAFYGDKFVIKHVSHLGNIEKISKPDLLKALKDATYKVPKKSGTGTYHKGRHPRKLLSLLDPFVVRSKAPHCDRLFRVLEQRLTRY
ncbi:DUF4276 family protein [bacterium]|nr:DUF4276 family protein [bacterium]